MKEQLQTYANTLLTHEWEPDVDNINKYLGQYPCSQDRQTLEEYQSILYYDQILSISSNRPFPTRVSLESGTMCSPLKPRTVSWYKSSQDTSSLLRQEIPKPFLCQALTYWGCSGISTGSCRCPMRRMFMNGSK